MKKPVSAKKFTEWGDPILSTPTKAVPLGYIKSKAFKKTVNRMFEMIKGIGVGLAANQIGLNKKFAVVMIEPNPLRPDLIPLPRTVIVNPNIKNYSKIKQRGWEGCLSCPGPRFFIERAKSINVVYIDGLTGKKVNRQVEGFQARVFQHEIDHLNGKVCGEQILIKNGKIVQGSIVTCDWYLKTKGAPPNVRKS